MKYGETYRNALAIQRLVVRDAKADGCEPKVRCLLARAFGELELLKLRLRMKPAPKPIDVSGVVRGRKPKNLVPFTEVPDSGSQPQQPIAPKSATTTTTDTQ